MNASEFWELIEKSDRVPEVFQHLIRQLDREQLIALGRHFRLFSSELLTEQLEDLLPDYSEDSMEDLTDWVVSQGHSYYLLVLTDPAKHLPKEAFEIDDGLTENSFAGYVESEFFLRFNEPIVFYF